MSKNRNTNMQSLFIHAGKGRTYNLERCSLLVLIIRLLKSGHGLPLNTLSLVHLNNTLSEVSVMMWQAESGYGPNPGCLMKERGWMGAYQVVLRELKWQKKKKAQSPPEISFNLSVRWGFKVPMLKLHSAHTLMSRSWTWQQQAQSG